MFEPNSAKKPKMLNPTVQTLHPCTLSLHSTRARMKGNFFAPLGSNEPKDGMHSWVQSKSANLKSFCTLGIRSFFFPRRPKGGVS
jgi:hypothetical protein